MNGIKSKVGNILLIGPPGAGKGTQAQWLTENFSLEKIDTGSLIRQAIKNETEVGKIAKSYVEQGKLIPDETVIKLILGELMKLKEKNINFLLDGFPRNLVQAKALKNALEENNLTLDKVILIDVNFDDLVRRITGRRICTNKSCGAVYHLLFAPPALPDTCDKCSSPLYQRDDDKEQLVKARLETYLQETEPLIGFYENEGILSKLDGNKPMNDVSQNLRQLLKES
jgi:adenylate kinase